MRYSKQYHACLVELWNWRKSIRGPGVRNTIQGLTINAPVPRSIQQADPTPATNGIATGTGQRQGMAYMNVTQNQMGSSYPFAHELD